MNASILLAAQPSSDSSLLKELCEAAGLSVHVEASGSEALTAAGNSRPDVLLVDADLPYETVSLRESDVDLAKKWPGISLVTAAKRDESLARTPVIVLVEDGDDDGASAAFTVGAESVITRPYRIHTVEETIRQVLRKIYVEERAATSRRDLAMAYKLRSIREAGEYEVAAENECQRATKHNRTLSAVVVRVDAFRIPAVRSAQWEQVALQIRRSIRLVDHLFEINETDFLLLLPETSKSQARTVVQRIEERARAGVLTGGMPLPVAMGVVSSEEVEKLNAASLRDAALAAVVSTTTHLHP